MSASSAKFCTGCGAALRPGVKFCESCGTRVETGGDEVTSSAPAPGAFFESGEERLVGQVPCAWVLEKKGFFGGHKTRQGNLLITNRRLVFLHETSKSNDEEVYEDERLEEEARKRGIELRELVRDYDWFGGPGKRFVDSPVDELLRENRDNWEVTLDQVNRARLWLSPDDCPEQLEVEDGETSPHRFQIYRAAGEAVEGWLGSLLGPGRFQTSTDELFST